jgi:hypothetical protein
LFGNGVKVDPAGHAHLLFSTTCSNPGHKHTCSPGPQFALINPPGQPPDGAGFLRNVEISTCAGAGAGAGAGAEPGATGAESLVHVQLYANPSILNSIR